MNSEQNSNEELFIKKFQPLEPFQGILTELKNSVVEEACTIVHCTYVAKSKYINGGWVNIYPTTYLDKPGSFESLQLLHAFNIPIAPARHSFSQTGDVKRFTLYFPAVPKDWTLFSLIELSDGQDGFTEHNIKRNSTGVYEVFLR